VTVGDQLLQVALDDRGEDLAWQVGSDPQVTEASISTFTGELEVLVRGTDGQISRVGIEPPPPLPRRPHTAAEGVVAIVAPLSGTVAAVRVAVGDAVETGQLLVVLEAMKMEHRVVATESGFVREVLVAEGGVVREGDVLVEVE
jgi:propionyl-CoA carboxylase alpha chain